MVHLGTGTGIHGTNIAVLITGVTEQFFQEGLLLFLLIIKQQEG
jgi:hypothetical protein